MTMPLEFLSGVIAFAVTVMILSYVIDDNPLFRFGSYLFVGVSAGYIAAVAWHEVLYPLLVVPLWQGDLQTRLLLFFPLILSLMLFGSLSPRLAGMARPVLGVLVGVGAAVAVGGVVSGTLLPLVQSTASLPALGNAWQDARQMEALLDGVVILLGTVVTLLYFQFGVNPRRRGQRSRLMKVIAWLGQAFIAIALGVVFAGAFAAALAALVERLSFIYSFLSSFTG
jgi:hypothetical protein